MGKRRLVHGRGEKQGQSENLGLTPQSPASHHDAHASLSRVRDTSVVGTPPAVLPLVSPEGAFTSPLLIALGGHMIGLLTCMGSTNGGQAPRRRGATRWPPIRGDTGQSWLQFWALACGSAVLPPRQKGHTPPQAGVALGRQDIEQEGRSPVC